MENKPTKVMFIEDIVIANAIDSEIDTKLVDVLASITETQVRALLTFNFCPTDFDYDNSLSPVDNLLCAIDLFGEAQRESTLSLYQ